MWGSRAGASLSSYAHIMCKSQFFLLPVNKLRRYDDSSQSPVSSAASSFRVSSTLTHVTTLTAVSRILLLKATSIVYLYTVV